MSEQQSIEERFALLESRVGELERQRRVQEDRDIALLARIDDFIDDLRRIERVQMRGFEELKADQQEIKVGQRNLEAGQHNMEQALGVIVDTLKNHKASIETLAGNMNQLTTRIDHLEAGQQQIIAILTGNLPRND